MPEENNPLCDRCTKPSNNDQEYVGHGMMFCQECIEAELVRMPCGQFRFKTSQEIERDRCNVTG